MIRMSRSTRHSRRLLRRASALVLAVAFTSATAGATVAGHDCPHHASGQHRAAATADAPQQRTGHGTHHGQSGSQPGHAVHAGHAGQPGHAHADGAEPQHGSHDSGGCTCIGSCASASGTPTAAHEVEPTRVPTVAPAQVVAPHGVDLPLLASQAPYFLPPGNGPPHLI